MVLVPAFVVVPVPTVLCLNYYGYIIYKYEITTAAHPKTYVVILVDTAATTVGTKEKRNKSRRLVKNKRAENKIYLIKKKKRKTRAIVIIFSDPTQFFWKVGNVLTLSNHYIRT